MVKKGFTLIELLVVIAIIAILAAILFPVFARAREKARQTSCLSNIKQLTLGVQMYVQDFDERFPPLLCTDGATYLYTVLRYFRQSSPTSKTNRLADARAGVPPSGVPMDNR